MNETNRITAMVDCVFWCNELVHYLFSFFFAEIELQSHVKIVHNPIRHWFELADSEVRTKKKEGSKVNH